MRHAYSTAIGPYGVAGRHRERTHRVCVWPKKPKSRAVHYPEPTFCQYPFSTQERFVHTKCCVRSRFVVCALCVPSCVSRVESMEGRSLGGAGDGRDRIRGINTTDNGAGFVSSSSAVSGDTRYYTTGTASHTHWGCNPSPFVTRAAIEGLGRAELPIELRNEAGTTHITQSGSGVASSTQEPLATTAVRETLQQITSQNASRANHEGLE